MATLNANYEVEQGADFIQDIDLRDLNGNPLDLTGYSAASKIRKFPTSEKYNIITVIFRDRVKGAIRLFLSKDITVALTSGRNYYDLMLTRPDGIVEKALEGSIIVNTSSTTGYVEARALDGLGTIDTSNLTIGGGSGGDGYVLMFDATTQTFVFVNPDEVLSQATIEPQQPGLPSDFLDEIDDALQSRINIDAGVW
jgi:hypothetical protein